MRRWWLLPLVPVYFAGLRVAGWMRRERRLGWPVVSVGSLSAGGAGKTPVVLMLAAMLKERGFEVRVLSRGYGRQGGERQDVDGASGAKHRPPSSAGVERVEVGGTAERFGDEPLMMARRGMEVWVGADRRAAGVAAMRAEDARGRENAHKSREPRAESMGRPVFLLDDGFQHRRLARDVEVVLLTVKDVQDCLLPAGDLREPLGALRRADVVVLREDEADRLRPLVARLAGSGTEVWVVRRRLRVPVGREVRRGVAFCGIARPEGFVTMLAAAGLGVAGVVAFRDHHRYGGGDIRRLVDVARRVGADGFFITEKDAVKLTAAMVRELEVVGPVVVASLELELVEGSIDLLAARLDRCAR